jgi:hypothetical protein
MPKIIASGATLNASIALLTAVEREMGKGLEAKYGDDATIYVDGKVSPEGHAIITSMRVKFL